MGIIASAEKSTRTAVVSPWTRLPGGRGSGGPPPRTRPRNGRGGTSPPRMKPRRRTVRCTAVDEAMAGRRSGGARFRPSWTRLRGEGERKRRPPPHTRSQVGRRDASLSWTRPRPQKGGEQDLPGRVAADEVRGGKGRDGAIAAVKPQGDLGGRLAPWMWPRGAAAWDTVADVAAPGRREGIFAADEAVGGRVIGAAVQSIQRTRLRDGCVATAVSDAVRHACKLLQGSFCSAATWLRSLFASVDVAGTTADIYTSSCTPLGQLSLDLSVLNHSGRARNSLSTFGSPIRVLLWVT